MALAQQLAALNTKLCGTGGGSGSCGGLISTEPVLTQLDAAWIVLGGLFKLSLVLQLERNDWVRLAQAGSLLFDAGQYELLARLETARSAQAVRSLQPDAHQLVSLADSAAMQAGARAAAATAPCYP